MSWTTQEIETAAKAGHEAARQKNGRASDLSFDRSTETTKDTWRAIARATLEAGQKARGARIKENKTKREAVTQ